MVKRLVLRVVAGRAGWTPCCAGTSPLLREDKPPAARGQAPCCARTSAALVREDERRAGEKCGLGPFPGQNGVGHDFLRVRMKCCQIHGLKIVTDPFSDGVGVDSPYQSWVVVCP